jgi:hypothetical protein
MYLQRYIYNDESDNKFLPICLGELKIEAEALDNSIATNFTWTTAS